MAENRTQIEDILYNAIRQCLVSVVCCTGLKVIWECMACCVCTCVKLTKACG